MRGLENAIAVYSVRAVNSPPHPHVGTRRDRPAVIHPANTRLPSNTAPSMAGTTWSKSANDLIPSRPAGSIGAATPGNDANTPSSAWITSAGYSPNVRQTVARKARGASITAGASCAFSAASLLGNARKLIPNALTKQATANAVVNASTAPLIGNVRRVRPGTDLNPSSSA